MSNSADPNRLIDEYRKLLAMQIKLDVASAIRNHPHLAGPDSLRAYNELASDETIDKLVRELAMEEAQAAAARGEVPPAAMLQLAGFKTNTSSTN